MTDFSEDGTGDIDDSASALIPSEAFLGDPERSVTARGTEDGLVLRIDGKAEWGSVLEDLESFLGGRRRFFEGGEVSVEWLDRLPTKEQSKELEQFLRDNYGMEVSSKPKRSSRFSAARDKKPQDESQAKTIHLFDEVNSASDGGSKSARRGSSSSESSGRKSGVDSDADKQTAFSLDSEGDEAAQAAQRYVSRIASMLGEDAYCEEEANARIHFGTLRSGQRIETPYSLVVVGDVNPGADLVAGGDIVVFGSLRGTAHASAYDEESLESIIVALHMQPMQLRIGSVISRGSDDKVSGAEIARIDNRRIVVDVFNPRVLFGRGLRRFA